MERKVSVCPFPFGTRVFMHRNGVIREAEYRGMRIKDTGICGNNVDTEHIFWFGSKLGEEKFKASMPIYKTAEDAAKEANPIQYEMLNIESFSLRYLPHLVWDGIQFCGWLWDGSRPVKRATREPLRVCEIYGGEVTFVDYSGNEYYAEHFRRFYETADNVGRQTNPKLSRWMKKRVILQNRSVMSFVNTSSIIVPALRVKSSGNISKHIKLCRGICLNK